MHDSTAKVRNEVLAGLWGCLLLSSCGGTGSALNPASQEAQGVSDLFWQLCLAGAVIALATFALAIYALRSRDVKEEKANRLILVGTALITVVLTGLVAVGVMLLPAVVAEAPSDALHVTITGERWWWRVRYTPTNAAPFEIANEVRLPVGQPVRFSLRSGNVIHSFWIPALGGKIDVIPGRENSLVLHPTKIGLFRGVCAEFCGKGHSNMVLQAMVVAPAEFQSWVEQQGRAADSEPVR